ncbi:TM2 domain-containing protein [Methylomonas paludis]|uniref:TM2 domain-containing protein n=1 Tax=Methylomonas paludis TaxID=1173101 RepID=A0A975R980_9GAMM|nr:TM2 domain-containing protein [Methylomonas paludis]QWF70802.1 TM2 domain-containing protein [Methylomonas paludis]
MLGHIESYDEAYQTGIVKSENDYYEFHLNQWTSEAPPSEGDDVEFTHEEGIITEINLVGAYLAENQPVKSRALAAFLGIAFGAIGLQRFYLGYYVIGVLQIVVTLLTGGFGVMWGFVEGVLIYAGHMDRDAKGRHLK